MKARERRNRKIKWSAEKKEYLRMNYKTEDTGMLAERLGVSRQAVVSMAHQMGIVKIAKRKQMEWTPEKEGYLKENYGTGKLVDMAKHLECTEAQIKWKAQRLGLKRTKKRFTNGIAREKEVSFGNPKRIGMNRHEVSKATWTVVCSCAIDGYTPEQTATMTERSVEQIQEILKECKENGYLERIRRNRTEGLAARYDRSVLRKCSGAVNVE